MGKRGPRPLGAAHHVMVGNYRPNRHGPRITDDTADPVIPSELSEAEQAKQKAEIAAFRQRLYGEAGPPDPGPRSGGAAKRIRW